MGASGDALHHGGTTKYLLRQAMAGTLPESIRKRTGKTDITLPLIDAVDTYLSHRPFSAMQPVRLGWIDAGVLADIHTSHRNWHGGGDDKAMPSMPYAPVWNLVAVDIWLEHAVGL